MLLGRSTEEHAQQDVGENARAYGLEGVPYADYGCEPLGILESLEGELSVRDMGGEMYAAFEVYARGVNVKGLEKYDCLVG